MLHKSDVIEDEFTCICNEANVQSISKVEEGKVLI